MGIKPRKFRAPVVVSVVAGLLSLLFATPSTAQQPAKKEFTLRGRVEQVDAAAKRLTVASEPIEGWMGGMTMAYRVSNAEVLAKLKPGDQITAKVHEGDFTLYNVSLAGQSSPSAPAAAKPPGLSLETLEQMALSNNPTIAQVLANLRAASGLARQAGLYPNPTVGYYGDEIRGGFSGGGKQGGFFSQTIVLGGKLGAARRVAQLQASQVETSGQVQRLRILNNVRVVFYQVLAAQRLVEVRQNLVKLAGDTIQTSLQLANVGQADRPDILQAEVERQQATVALRVADQELQVSWRVLAAVVGKPDLPLTRLDADLEAIPELNYDEWLATTLRESPEVKLAQQAVERAEASLVQAKKVPIPDLQVTGILAQNYEPLETTRKPTGLQGGAQIGIQLPIFNRNQGGVTAAKADIEAAKQNLSRVKLQLQRELAGIFRDYSAARVLVQQYKAEMLPRAEQAYRLYQANYQRMAGAYPQVLISQRTLFQLEAEYVQALGNAWQGALILRGFGLMDGLAEPMSPSSGMDQGGNSGMNGYNSRPATAQ
jgi:cobalt-zinc-cadmium efflux system outer membrane protein